MSYRNKNLLRYGKPSARVIIIASILTLVVISGISFKPAAAKQDLSSERIVELTNKWASALMTRDGKPRYEMMSEAMKDKFEQEQMIRSRENWNYNIGVSSPWVVDYSIKINGETATITYSTRTSEPASYQSEETVHFGKANGKLVVDDYRTVYEDALIK
ncbi:hypothetical protein PCCS19_02630 [Paenibacillus sp. CCS19]|uniref:hypothetical protein n=1 Tax=Paenibacillus sp. CCS19 TaxID=3158387 RepID=UPI00255DFA12|nr:hypothetical protein [Paenibacillus cellulosilyticus]GMK37210.1 hypothetical protein PCCS19_02630 [Paenibacillus cellulosilyticus]